MKVLLIASLTLLTFGCGGSGPISPVSQTAGGGQASLSPSNFSPAGTVFHAGDKVYFGATYSACCAGAFNFAVEFVRDDGAELMSFCGGGSIGPQGGNGGGGYNGWLLSTTDAIYRFGLGHTMNAALAGAVFPSNPISPSNSCPFGATFAPINWGVATMRVDVPLGWRIEP